MDEIKPSAAPRAGTLAVNIYEDREAMGKAAANRPHVLAVMNGAPLECGGLPLLLYKLINSHI